MPVTENIATINKMIVIKLSEAYPDTFWAIDRDLYFDKSIFLDLYWNPYYKIGFHTTFNTTDSVLVDNAGNFQPIVQYT